MVQKLSNEGALHSIILTIYLLLGELVCFLN